MNRVILRLFPAAVAIGALVPATLALSGTPLRGERLLPDLDQEPPSGLLVTRSPRGWQLGFASAVRNIGAGPLIIDGHRISYTEQTMKAEQMKMGRSATRGETPPAFIAMISRLRASRPTAKNVPVNVATGSR